jgi:ribonuclease J
VKLEVLTARNITQAARRTVGKRVGETYRRQLMIVPTVIEI